MDLTHFCVLSYRALTIKIYFNELAAKVDRSISSHTDIVYTYNQPNNISNDN